MTIGNLKTHALGQFDFGLSATQEARSAKLHRESIVLDMVSQHAGGNIFAHYPEEMQADFQARVASAGSTGWVEAIWWPYEMSKDGKSDLLRDWYRAAGLTGGAYDIDRLVHGYDPLSSNWEVRALRYAELPWLRYVTTAAEIRQAKRDGVVAFYANYQSLTPVSRDLRAFDVAYAKGLRSFMPAYNRMDHIGVGCTERVDAGLSMFGIEVVKHCNELGMIVDVSHCGHLTTMDVCRHSSKPVTANHSAARSVFSHARNKSNEALRAIAGTGGVIGVVAVPFFLSNEDSPTIERMLDHMDYIASLVGSQHVAIGTDWPLQAPDAVLKATIGAELAKNGFRTQDRVDVTKRLIGFDDCRDFPNITRGLVKRGYSDEQVRGILGENALRVFEQVCG
jgi:membrane dipeptidase